MDSVETEGDSIDAAIDNALKALGVTRDKITVDIISEGRKGILGFGAQKAKIRASLRKSVGALQEAPAAKPSVPEPKAQELKSRPAEARPPRPVESRPPRAEPRPPVTPAAVAPATESAPPVPAMSAAETAAMVEKAKVSLGEIMNLMGVNGTVEQRGAVGDETILEIKSEDSGLIIGRKGQTLEALQYLVARIAGERPGGDGPHVLIDIENYHERRRKTLQDMALRLGEKAKRQRKTVTVDALSAADRKIVHAALQDDPWLTTKSLGQGAYRRLLIIPEGDRRKKEDGESQGAERSGGRPPRPNRPNPQGSPESGE